MRDSDRAEWPVRAWPDGPIDPEFSSSRLLVLDASERRIRGIEMPPLLTGELKLLSYLGERACTWQSSYSLSSRVYGRDDGSARQLVWKYASTLRKKLAKELPTLIELCHRRGYSCRRTVTTVEPERDAG